MSIGTLVVRSAVAVTTGLLGHLPREQVRPVLAHALATLFATHPPMAERIRRLGGHDLATSPARAA